MMKGLLCYIASRVLYALASLVGFWIGVRRAYREGGWKGVDDKLLKLATGRDILGGVVCSEWFNRALIRQDAPVKFGDRWITISEVLGLNARVRKLTMTGRRLKNLLGVIQPGHIRKAAADDKL